jgi:hypothetical protein
MIVREKISPRGAPILVDAVRVNAKTLIISGKLIKTASLKNEWQEDIDDPDEVIRALKQSGVRVDFLKFWQRIPETEPKFSYYKEWRQVAAIPIQDFKHWWDKQIRFRARNKIRKAQKMGVSIEQVEFNDDFVRGVVDIYNQSPIRRGKPFRHYGKDFQTVKAELSVDLGEAVFVAAYFEKELIGFIKFVLADRYAMVTLILDKTLHRDKSPMNGMIAKVVEICAQRGIPYFTYTLWRRGDHGKFQESVGFEKIPVPEYYVPLTALGWIALRLRLHEGVKGLIPEKLMVWLLALRSKWYTLRFAQKIASRSVAPRSTDGKSLTLSAR